ncbi:hypothetical protein [Streptomyces sp. CBMA156]|uniref:hypothetical protein n=1 Tax=Streptomyces sp. CBMA156 TaxID=1930280 RepID=UPI0016618C9F|nr:hypothetical protein [Streptomyces sp. CBMA156]MBD0675092.1 hypothetical protein [Streptomyces sp. CBMA156]
MPAADTLPGTAPAGPAGTDGAEAAAAALRDAGQQIMVILGLFAGVGAIVVAVLARRIPKITWR